MALLGDALAQLLAERGISQNELGRRLGVTGSAVNLWVRGRSKPSREHIERIEDELTVDPRGSLLRLAGYSSDSDNTPTVESLIRADPGLDPEDKRVLLRVILLARERHRTRPAPTPAEYAEMERMAEVNRQKRRRVRH